MDLSPIIDKISGLKIDRDQSAWESSIIDKISGLKFDQDQPACASESDSDLDDDLFSDVESSDDEDVSPRRCLRYLPPGYVTKDNPDNATVLAGARECFRDQDIRRNPTWPKESAQHSTLYYKIEVCLVLVHAKTIDVKITFVILKAMLKLIKPKAALEYMHVHIFNERVLPNDDSTLHYIVRGDYDAGPAREREPPSASNILLAMCRMLEREIPAFAAANSIGPTGSTS